MMLDLNKLCASAEECLGWPYVSPGTNDARGIDCSGLFVKCYRDQGASIYHGSNTIYRKYCSDKGKLTSVNQLQRGMAVFKWNPNTPAKFDDGLGDFQHIGLVVSVSPLRIIHASSAAGCVTTDTKLGKWAYWGWLKDVARDGITPEPEKGDEEPVSAVKTAVVFAESGSTVNMRVRANASAALVERVPIGAAVEVLGTGNKWSKVKYGTWTGYMMTQFLTTEDPAPAELETGLTLEERVARLEKRVALLEMEGVG